MIRKLVNVVRPTKYRLVENFPDHTYFVPVGRSQYEIDEIILKVEELEAIRLKDMEGLFQEACAQKMQVSRATFQNILDSARKKIALALIQGKAIKISGGHYTTHYCKFKCLDCNYLYDIKFKLDRTECPVCGSNHVACIKKRHFCQKWCDR